MTSILIAVTLVITCALFVLNVLLALIFRKRQAREILSYVVMGFVEFVLFGFTLLLRLGVLRHVPYHLPPGLPFNRAEIGAAISIGMGLFPAAYWHRTSIAKMRARMEQDAQTLKKHEAGVRVGSNTSGEWMN